MTKSLKSPALRLAALLICIAVPACEKPADTTPGAGAKPVQSHEELAAEVIELMNAFILTMDESKDPDGARAAVGKLDQLASQFENLAKRMEEAGPPSGATKDKIEQMIRDNKKIIRQRTTQLSSVILSKREIGEILQEGINEFGERVDKLKVLEEWSGEFGPNAVPEPDIGDDNVDAAREAAAKRG